MTTAILKSINSRDKLYKSLMLTPRESPNYLEVQRNFKTYKNIIRRCIMLAKRDYYNKLFNKDSKNLKMTWKAINDTLNRHKTKSRFPETFKQLNGKIISDPKKLQQHLTIILLALVRWVQLHNHPTVTFQII